MPQTEQEKLKAILAKQKKPTGKTTKKIVLPDSEINAQIETLGGVEGGYKFPEQLPNAPNTVSDVQETDVFQYGNPNTPNLVGGASLLLDNPFAVKPPLLQNAPKINPQTENEFQSYLKFTKKPNTPETRAEYDNLLKQNESFGQNVEVSANVNEPNITAVNPIAVRPQPQTPNAVALPNESNRTQTVKTGDVRALWETQAGKAIVDLTKFDGKGDINEWAFRQSLQTLGLNGEQINRVIDRKKAKGEPMLSGESVSREDGQIQVGMNFGNLIVGLGGDENNIPQEVKDRFQNLQTDKNLELYTSPKTIGKDALGENITATDYINEQSRQIRQRDDADFQLRQKAISNVMRDPFADSTDAGIQDEIEFLKKAKVPESDLEESRQFGQSLNQTRAGQLFGGVMGSVGNFGDFFAGMFRPLRSIGIDAPSIAWTQVAEGARIINAETNKNADTLGKGLNLVGSLPLDLTRLAVLSRLPSGAVAGFAVDSALQSAGRNDSILEIGRQGLKGAGMGALFPASSKVGNVAKEFSPLLEPIARIGTVTGGTFTIEKVFGATNEEALQSAILNGVFETVQTYGAKGLNKIYRVWQKGTPTDVRVDGQGNVNLTRGQLPDSVIDIELVLDPQDGIYKRREDFADRVRTAQKSASDVQADTNIQTDLETRSNGQESQGNGIARQPKGQLEGLPESRQLLETNPERIPPTSDGQNIGLEPYAEKPNAAENEQLGNNFPVAKNELPQPQPQPAPIAEKPKTRIDYAEPENLANKLNKVYTEQGTTANIQPLVIDESDILTSSDADYPKELQPRDRTRKGLQAQVSEIANKLNPELLGDSPKASDGRPLVVAVQTADGKRKYAVISGNGRTEAIRAAYKSNSEPAQDYADFARTKDTETTAKNPVYVGVINPNEIEDLTEFARQANESTTAQMSATEQAKADAERLSPDTLNLFVPSDDGTIHTSANRDFTRAFLDLLPVTERTRLVDSQGKLNQDGANRVKNAIFAKAFGDSERGLSAIQRMTESTSNSVKNITNALLAKSGTIASFKDASKQGKRHQSLDLSNDLAVAMEKFASLRESGTPIEEYLQQGDLFGSDTTPFQKRIIQVFDTHKRSAKAVREILTNYYKISELIGNPQQTEMFAGEKPSASAILEASIEDYAERNTNQPERGQGLFDNQKLQLQREAKERRKVVAENVSESTRQTESVSNYGIENLRNPTVTTKGVEAPSLSRDLRSIIENDANLETLLKKAEIKTKADGELLINPEAYRLILEGFRNLYGDKVGVFFGAYIPTGETQRLVKTLETAVLGDYLPEKYNAPKRRFLNKLKQGISKINADLILLSTNAEYPNALKTAIEEERAHRADYRAGEKFSIGRKTVLSDRAGKQAVINLKKGAYSSDSAERRATEVSAKIFVVDGEKELGITKQDAKNLRLKMLKSLLDSGKTANEIRTHYENISPLGEKFSQTAQKYERFKIQRDKRTSEQAVTDRTEKLSAVGESNGRAGRSESVASGRYSPRKPEHSRSGILGTAEITKGDTVRVNKRTFTVKKVSNNGARLVLNGGVIIPASKANLMHRYGDLTKAENDYLEKAFGRSPERADAENDIMFSRAQDFKDRTKQGLTLVKNVVVGTLGETSALMRAAKTSLDLSAGGRQGLILSITHPVLAGKAFVKQIQSLKLDNYNKFKQYLDLHPSIELAEASGLYLSTLQGNDLNEKEEAFMSSLVGEDRVFKNNKVEKIRRGVSFHIRASERAYTTYLDSMRIETFTSLAKEVYETNARQGNPTTEAQMKALADFINTATGRAPLGRLQNFAKELNALFFAPRLVKSRFRLLNPVYYAKLPPVVRKIAIRKMLGFAVAQIAILTLFKMAGAEVEMIFPLTPDFLKVKLGNYRFDFGAGFVQPLRLITSLIGQIGNRRSVSDRDAVKVLKFARTKLAPLPSSALNIAMGENVIGEKATLATEAQTALIPLVANDIYKGATEDGLKGIFLTAPSVFGIGVQNYDSGTKVLNFDKPKKEKPDKKKK